MCLFPVAITKPGAQSLQKKNGNAELNFKEATVIYMYGLQLWQQDYLT